MSPIYNHLQECEHFNYMVNLHSLPPSSKPVKYVEDVQFAVMQKPKLLTTVKIGLNCVFLESIHIK